MTELPSAAEAAALCAADRLAPEATPSASQGQLAALLSRLASLQGQAVPTARFSLLDQRLDGVPLHLLDPAEQARAMWQARFPDASVDELRHDQLSRGDFPLLWIGAAAPGCALLRGRLSHGGCVAEDARGQPVELAPEDLAHGQLLALHAHRPTPDAPGEAPASATDWFRHALRQQRPIFLEAVLATFVISGLALAASLYSMQVYDRVLPSKGYATLWVLTVGVLLAVLLEFVLKQVRAHMVDRASQAIDIELSGVFFGKALDIRMDARPATVGTFASQIRHFESVRNFMTSATLFVMADAPFALFFIGVIALLAGPVALVPLAMIPVAVLAGLLYRAPIERLTRAHMEESNRKNGLLIEAIDGIDSIKAVAGEWKVLDRHQQLTATIAGNELRMRGLSSSATHLTQVLQQLSYVGLIAAGAYAVTSGSLTMGALIACSIISGRALAPLAQIPQFLVQWQHARMALQTLDGIMALPGERSPTARLLVPEACTGELRLEQVRHGYQPGRSALDIPSLLLRPGERVAVIGPVGSGKSTLIKVLSGLYQPGSGRLLLDGLDVTQLAPAFVREHMGYLPQDVRLFNGSLRENLTLGLPPPSDSRLLQACRLTGMDRVIQAHPQGLELPITEGGRGLSGGQRQLVGLTRLLLARPRVLLLDEPTASMDGLLEARVMQQLFDDTPADAVIVVVTHKMGLLAHVNRVIVMDNGRIALDGPRDAVLARLRQGPPSAASGAAAAPPLHRNPADPGTGSGTAPGTNAPPTTRLSP